MKKIISLLLLICLFSTSAFSDCDWTGIKELPDGGYEYSPTLNLCVGQLVQDSKVKDQQISDLNKAISLKDLALTTADQRTLLWQKTSDDQLNRLNTIQADQARSGWIYYALGAASMFLGAYAAAKIIHP